MNTNNNKNSQNNLKNDKILFISPPFGNYFPNGLINKIFNIQTYSIAGSFTQYRDWTNKSNHKNITLHR